MIFKDSREVTGIFNDSKSANFFFNGVRLVWQDIRSCYGRGYWINKMPWINSDKWKNNQ